MRYIVLLPQSDKDGMDIYSAFSTVGVCAYVEIEEIDYKAYWNLMYGMILNAGFSISSSIQDELCKTLENRYDKVENIEITMRNWLSQLHLNRQIAGSYNKEISLDDIRLLAGVATSKSGNRKIGFGIGR